MSIFDIAAARGKKARLDEMVRFLHQVASGEYEIGGGDSVGAQGYRRGVRTLAVQLLEDHLGETVDFSPLLRKSLRGGQ